MKYENAKDLLPPELLSEVQKYVAGKLMYVPIAEDARGWGTESGYRQKLIKRNQTIYNEYVAGRTVSELADEFFLSTDSIKKIVYGKKTEFIAFEPTIQCAIQYSEAGLAEEWIRAFCVSRQPQVVPLLQSYIHFGIVKMPLRLVEMPQVARHEQMPGDEQESKDKQEPKKPQGTGSLPATEDTKCIQTETPLLIRYMQGKFYLLGQEKQFLALKANKVNAYPVFILITDRAEYQKFMKNFGKPFSQAKM